MGAVQKCAVPLGTVGKVHWRGKLIRETYRIVVITLTGVHLLTFSSKGYSSPERFLQQARDSGFFETMEVYSDQEISELIRSKALHFILWRKKGFGFWLWKPRIILDRLAKIPEGDFLVYLDQGFHIQKSGAKTLSRYLNEIEGSGSWVGVFSTGGAYRPELFVRQQAVVKRHPEFYKGEFGEYVYAGILLIKNTPDARKCLREWQEMCEETPLLAPLNMGLTKAPGFIGQDGDNGYLPVVLDKHGGYLKFSEGEVNLNNHEGLQMHHVLPKLDWPSLDWSSMRDKPFLLKRDV